MERAGIGGALRNSKGEVPCAFSAFVGNVDAPTAELMAIHKACMLCSANVVLSDRMICFESDSKEAIGGVKDVDFGNLLLVEVIYDIRSKLRSLDNSSLEFVPRGAM